MQRHVSKIIALAVGLALAAAGDHAIAQGGMMAAMGNSTPMFSRPKPTATPATQVRQVQYESYGDGGGYMSGCNGGCNAGGCGCDGGCPCDCGPTCGCDGCCEYGGCDDCCDYGSSCGCSSSGCSSSWCDWCGCDWLCGSSNSRHWFFTADYLYVRSTFSDAVAYLDHDDSGDPFEFHDTFHQLEFQHESSYRLGGGWDLDCCGDQVRFMYTKMTSSADAIAPPGSQVPYETAAPPDGQTNIHAGVDSKTFDLEFAKTIPLGGCTSCGCNDCNSCGCSSGCGRKCCPAWDITWSGGIRFADIGWGRVYDAVDANGATTIDTRSLMNFKGGGPRVGLEGRRYFGSRNWCSAYLKGNLSLLLGDIDLQATRTRVDGVTIGQNEVTTLASHNRQIIPVTEIEAGASAQLTNYVCFSTGYLFAAYHDLGFRDQFNFPTFLETNYDDANILGFDGFFARLEVNY